MELLSSRARRCLAPCYAYGYDEAQTNSNSSTPVQMNHTSLSLLSSSRKYMPNGTFSLAIKHRLAAYEIVRRRLRAGLVLEDDVAIPIHFWTVLAVVWLPQNAEAFFLGSYTKAGRHHYAPDVLGRFVPTQPNCRHERVIGMHMPTNITLPIARLIPRQNASNEASNEVGLEALQHDQLGLKRLRKGTELFEDTRAALDIYRRNFACFPSILGTVAYVLLSKGAAVHARGPITSPSDLGLTAYPELRAPARHAAMCRSDGGTRVWPSDSVPKVVFAPRRWILWPAASSGALPSTLHRNESGTVANDTFHLRELFRRHTHGS